MVLGVRPPYLYGASLSCARCYFLRAALCLHQDMARDEESRQSIRHGFLETPKLSRPLNGRASLVAWVFLIRMSMEPFLPIFPSRRSVKDIQKPIEPLRPATPDNGTAKVISPYHDPSSYHLSRGNPGYGAGLGFPFAWWPTQ